MVAGAVQPPARQQLQEQQLLMHRLLRRSSGAPAGPPASPAAAGDGGAVVSPPAPPAAPATPGAPLPVPRHDASADGNAAAAAAAGQQDQWGQADREAACERRRRRQVAQTEHGAQQVSQLSQLRGQERAQQAQQALQAQHPTQHPAQHPAQQFECEPRQALMWAIAGRATSMSWQDSGSSSTAAAAVSVATVPALAAGPLGGVPVARAAAGSMPVAQAAAGKAAVPVAAAAGTAGGAPALPEALVLPAAAATTLGMPAEAAAVAAVPALAAQIGPGLGRDAAAAQPLQPSLLHLPAKHRTSLEHSPWPELQPELLAAVLAQAGHSATTARTLCQVCPAWRQGLAGERGAMRHLRFACLHRLSEAEAAGGSSSSSRTSSGSSASNGGGGSRRAASPQLPRLLELAIQAGNISATVLAARHLEQRQLALLGGGSGVGGVGSPGDDPGVATWYGSDRRSGRAAAAGESDAARLWCKAAKLGHPEAQWKLGFARYKGLMGLLRDGEEANLWLTRAAKQLGGVTGVPLDTAGPTADAAAVESAAPMAAAAGKPLPALMDTAACRQILSQAAHILGYLNLDGEGTKADVATAIRWFRLAERHGCREAARVLGSLYNTGQYA